MKDRFSEFLLLGMNSLSVKFVIFLVFLLLIFFSGCSVGLNNGNSDYYSNSKVDNTGNGLSVRFDLDVSKIKQNIVPYILIIENTGKEDVILDKSNFKFVCDKFNSKDFILSNSKKQFYDSIFRGNDKIILPQNQKITVKGVLQTVNVADIKTISSFRISLFINYSYKTVFFSNLKFKKNYGFYDIISGLNLEQAAPIQIKKIGLLQTNPPKIEFYVSDFGMSDEGYILNSKVKVNSFRAKFSDLFLNGCKVKFNDGRIEVLNNFHNFKKGSNFIISCPVSLESLEEMGDLFVTQVSGEFSYIYPIKIVKVISIN